MKVRATPPELLLSGAEGAVPKLRFSLPGQAWDFPDGHAWHAGRPGSRRGQGLLQK